MKKFQIITVILLLAGVAVFTSGCGEKVAEKIIETSTGGQVDVDIDDDTVTVNTSTGSMTTSDEGVSIPDNFPSDVYITDGNVTAVLTNASNDGYTVTIQSSKNVSAVKAEYEDEFENDGWTITMSLEIFEGATIGAEKGERTATVSISDDDDEGTLVIVGTSTSIDS